MVGRKFNASSSGYRYGFNGKEMDNDMNSLTAYDYGFRIYNPAIGKFLSVDPLTEKYPYYTPYQFAGNQPIQCSDIDGAEQWAKNYVSWSRQQAIMQQEAAASKAQKAPAVSTPKPAPVLSNTDVSESTCQGCAARSKQIAMTKAASAPKKVMIKQGPVVGPDKRSYFEKEQSEQFKAGYERNKALEKATMDQFAGQQILMTANTGSEYVKQTVSHGVGIVEGIKEGDGLKIAGNTLGLTLDVAPIFPLMGVSTAANIPSRLARVIPEEFAGSPTLGRAGAADVFVTDASQLSGLKTSEAIAGKLTLKNADGTLVKGPFRIIEFDTPTSGLAQPFNRANPGFINGGKTAGGATEYIIPNANLSDLKNVTQKTIK